MPETELKFALAAGDLKRLSRHPAFKTRAERARLTSSYFDTPELKLRDAGMSLRVRQVGDRNVQTVKTTQGRGLFERSEWESDIATAEPDLDRLSYTPAGERLNGDSKRLEAVFVTSVDRGVRHWTHGRAMVEIAVDRGEIKAGAAREPILELELELKTGPEADLYAFVEELADFAPLKLSFGSKRDRGYRLLSGEPEAAVTAPKIELLPDMRLGDAFAAVMRSCLMQIDANARMVRRGDDEAALHQARIGIRRLRAALSVFKPLIEDQAYVWVKAEAAAVGKALNAARDLDVFLTAIHLDDSAFENEPAVARLVDRVRAARKEAYAEVRNVMESDRFAQFVLKTALWVECGPWTQAAAGTALREHPVAVFAAQVLESRTRRLKKRLKGLAGADVEARHAARILAKKLRYAAEFFETATQAKAGARKRFIKRLRAVQDRLGALNDIAKRRETAMLPRSGRNAADLAFAAGLIVAQGKTQERAAIASAVEAAKAWRSSPQYWPS